MVKSLNDLSKWADAFRKSQGGTRRLGVSVTVDLDKALRAFKMLVERIKEAL